MNAPPPLDFATLVVGLALGLALGIIVRGVRWRAPRTWLSRPAATIDNTQLALATARATGKGARS